MIDEKALIKQLGDPSTKESAFTHLVREYQEPLYWQIRKMVLIHDDADDVLQNTFIKAWSAIDSFRGESRLQTWLFRIAINESLNHLSKKKQVLSLEQGDMNFADMLASDSYFDGDEVQKQFQEAISTLPDKQKLVFNLTGTKVATIRIDSGDKTFALNLSKGCYLIKVGKVVRKISIQ